MSRTSAAPNFIWITEQFRVISLCREKPLIKERPSVGMCHPQDLISQQMWNQSSPPAHEPYVNAKISIDTNTLLRTNPTRYNPPGECRCRYCINEMKTWPTLHLFATERGFPPRGFLATGRPPILLASRIVAEFDYPTISNIPRYLANFGRLWKSKDTLLGDECGP